jgi:ankyrin repeat protein
MKVVDIIYKVMGITARRSHQKQAMEKGAYTKLHYASQRGDLPAVQELLAKGGNPNHFDEGGCTPLHYAAAAGHLKVVDALLAAGANVNARDDEAAGDTPIGYIAQNCSVQMAQVLIDAGADPTIPGSMQLTALHRAMKRKRGEGQDVYQLLRVAAAKLGKHTTQVNCSGRFP